MTTQKLKQLLKTTNRSETKPNETKACQEMDQVYSTATGARMGLLQQKRQCVMSHSVLYQCVM